MRKRQLDEKDRMILSILQEDASISMDELSFRLREQKGIKLSRQAVQARIKKLKDEGVFKIKGVVDHAKIGQEVLAFVLVSFLPGSKHSQRELGSIIAEIPGVHGVWIISGEWDILLKVRGSSLEDIGNFIIDRLRDVEGVGKTITCASFEVVKEEY